MYTNWPASVTVSVNANPLIIERVSSVSLSSSIYCLFVTYTGSFIKNAPFVLPLYVYHFIFKINFLQFIQYM